MKEILGKLRWDVARDRAGVSRLQEIHPMYLQCCCSTSNQPQNNPEVNFKARTWKISA